MVQKSEIILVSMKDRPSVHVVCILSSICTTKQIKQVKNKESKKKIYKLLEITFDTHLSIPSPTSILTKLPIVTLEPTSFDKSFSRV
jgi:adenylate kinase